MEEMKKYLAEAVGTMLLVVFGCGVAVATGCIGNDGIVATALAFGLVIVALAYSIGNVSGCHVNPDEHLARDGLYHVGGRQAQPAPLIPAAFMRQERRSRPCERNTTHPTAAAL